MIWTRSWRGGGAWAHLIADMTRAEAAATTAQIRKLYTRALWIPLPELDALMKDYEKFEYGVNKDLAKKLCQEIQQRVGVALHRIGLRLVCRPGVVRQTGQRAAVGAVLDQQCRRA